MDQNYKNSNLYKTISSIGNNKEAWEDLICEINTADLNFSNNIIYTLQNFLIEKSNIEITLDIIDFLVHYGSSTIVELIAKKDFLKLILELLKNSSKSSVTIQKKVIFLTQKWAKKFEKENNPKYSAFIDNYNTLKKGGIIFPPNNFKLETYNKYITDEEIQNALMKANVINKIKEDNKKSIIDNNKENNFANPFLSEMGELDNIADEKIFNNENTSNKMQNNNNKGDIDNPYCENNYNNINQDNHINGNNFNQINNLENNFNNNNINDINNNNNINDNNYNINNNINPLENQKNNYNNNFNEQSNEQNSIYPKFPSQFGNNSNNNDFNNNQQNNNMYNNNINFNNNFSNNNNKNNQFSNYNNNDNRNNRNNYNNGNNNYNMNNNNFNNNFNNNYNNNNYINNNYNRNNNNNYNNNQNYNQNRNYNNENNNNYYRSNTNFTNNRVNNNNFNNFRSNNDTFDIISFKQTLGNKLLKLNAWINDGKYSFNSGNLKEGMLEILNEIPKCEYMMNRCQLNNDKRGYEVVRNMKMDMEQTCSRYEDLVNDRRVEPFRSSFTGNSRQYYYNKNAMFGNSNNSSSMNDFNSYYYKGGNNGSGFSYSGQNYGNNYQKEETIGDKISDYGSKVKDGFCFVGGKIKDTAVSGFNFVKEKINDKKDTDDA